jgi:hypothetical protein
MTLCQRLQSYSAVFALLASRFAWGQFFSAAATIIASCALITLAIA